MSVLLEALKKAAEEKKKAMDESVSSGISSDDHSVDELATSQEGSASREGVSLTLASSDKMFDEASVQQQDEAITSNLVSTQEGQAGLKLNILNTEQEVQEVPEVQEVQEVQETLSLKRPVEEVPDSSKGGNESFEWSIDELPGYTSDTDINSSQTRNNPVLVSGALSKDNLAVRKDFSRKAIISLFGMSVFIVIGFYSFIYFQEQADTLEKSMHKYRLVKVEAPKKAITISSPAIAAEQLPQAKPVDLVDSALPVSDGVAPPVLEQDTSRVVKASYKRPSKTVKASNTKSELSKQSVIQQVPSRESELLAEAYLAYERGEFIHAQKVFEVVLTINPRSVNALIGLGGISVSEKNYSRAIEFYTKALNIDSENLHAYEAIANISTEVNLNSEWEKNLLKISKIYPYSSILQVALGNFYAKEKNWLLAQEFFFKAYSLDLTNPDYIVNLGVSLDQLGQYKLAAQYYTEALSLINGHAVSFDQTQVKDRLISIQQFIIQEK